ncbi:hypothetical protein KEM56_006724 [Ascosphaera pollenicola]|nr:hypothetical protein KEM56_006724 [Ascosphaera pollenicola]
MSTATDAQTAQDEEGAGLRMRSGNDDIVNGRSDLQVYLEDSTRTTNDISRPSSATPNDVILVPTDGSFQQSGLSRANSVYSFSRSSFSSQLAQLMSIRLPEPSVLEGTIEGISTAATAVKTLRSYSNQMQQWIEKVLNVLGGLDADEDVEWAAAGGRQSLDDITRAATKFQSLVEIYIKAVERVPFRADIAQAGPEELTTLVFQMDNVMKNWEQVKIQLKRVKIQVELAMEWEKLWNAVLGDVSEEIDDISKLIFEMEERRHKTMAKDHDNDASHGVDINELETIVEESPATRHRSSNPRLSMAPGLSALHVMPPIETSARNAQDDTSLLALFARMQPLRASLDFLPMHLHAFLSRARTMFPSACAEIEERRMQLERKYEKLQADANTLKEELGEDRWIIVFRNAGKQANKMCDSVERTIGKLQEAIGVGGIGVNVSTIMHKIENFEAKRIYYRPAIERVLGIMEKGINDRLTINGEIVRLYSDLQARNEALIENMNAMEFVLNQLNLGKGQQIRDSMSSILTPDSPHTAGTPDSSPASSVVLSAGRNTTTSRRESSSSSISRTPAPKVNRMSGIPQPAVVTPTSIKRQSGIPRPGHLTVTQSCSRLAATSPTPRPSSRLSRSTTPAPGPTKPRWNSSSNTNELQIGHNYKPLSLTTPSPYRKEPPVQRLRTAASSMNISSAARNRSVPPPSPFTKNTFQTPAPATPSKSSRAASSLGFRPSSRLTNRTQPGSSIPAQDKGSATPSSTFRRRPSNGHLGQTAKSGGVLDPPPYSKLRKPSSFVGPSTPGTTRTGTKPTRPAHRTADSHSRLVGQKSDPSSSHRDDISDDEVTHYTKATQARPETSLGHSSRRFSLLPLPRTKESRQSASTRNLKDTRPPWR